MVRQNLRRGVGESFQDMGEQSLKNIDRKIRVWRWPASQNQSNAKPSHQPTDDQVRDTRSNIEIKPFETLSTDPEHKHLAGGFAEDIAAALSKFDSLRVVATKDVGLSQHSARYRVEGETRVAGPRIRCTSRLLEGADGHHLWAEKFDGVLEDIFDFQDRVTQEVTTAIEVELSDGPQIRVGAGRRVTPWLTTSSWRGEPPIRNIHARLAPERGPLSRPRSSVRQHFSPPWPPWPERI
jgi:TolB-like protein